MSGEVHLVSAGGSTRAVYEPEAGMLCRSFTYHGEELLSGVHGFEEYLKRGKTIAVPLLYPWANRLAERDYRAAGRAVALPDDPARISFDASGLPIHGAVPGTMSWEPQPREREDLVVSRLEWRTPELLELFPYRHEVRMKAHLTEGALTVTTEVAAVAGDEVPVSFGFHPYLRLPGSRRGSWHVNLPAGERILTDQRTIPTGAREPLAPTSFLLGGSDWDTGLKARSQPARFAVTEGGRGIAVELLFGFPFGQIYAPPEHDFICFEPMTAPIDALHSGADLPVVHPGGSYAATFRISSWREDGPA